MKKIVIASIGGGNSFKTLHLPVYNSDPAHFVLKGVFDINAETKNGAAELSHSKPYERLDELLQDEEVEVVLITTRPPRTHFELCLKVLESGKNVIVEKPMAETVKQCDGMIAMAKENKKLLTVFQNRRWDDYFEKMKDILANGEIGEPFMVKIGISGDYEDGDSLYDWGIHLFDQALQLNRSRLQEILGIVRYTDRGLYHTGMALAVMRFEKPPVIEYTNVPAEKNPDGTSKRTPWYAVGTKGVYVDSGGAGGFPNQKPFYDLLWKALRENGPVPVSPESARNAIYAIEKTLESAKLGKAVETSGIISI